jgi:hypothetical protein
MLNFGKPVNSIRGYAGAAGISSLILLSPALAFLSLIVAEALVDLLLVGGTGAAFAAVGAIGLVLSRRFWQRALNPGAVGEGGFGEDSACLTFKILSSTKSLDCAATLGR